MSIKRILALALVVLISLSILSGCAAKAAPSGLDDKGRFIYAIVRPAEETDADVLLEAKALRATIKQTFGSDIYYIKDIATEPDNDDYEILIGDTNRKESAKAKEQLINNRSNNAKDFIIKSKGKKIVIQAVKKEMLSLAVQWFYKNFCSSKEDWAKLTTNYEFLYEYDGAVQEKTNLVSGNDLGTYNVILPRQTSYIVGMGGETFRDYYNQFGYDVKVLDDFDPKDETEYEVIIGDTTRKESASLKVEGDNYVIKVIGKKVVIKGGSDLATWRANQEFLKLVMKDEGFEWSDGYTINGKYDEAEDGAYTLNWGDEFNGSSIDLTKWGDYHNESDDLGESCLGGVTAIVDPYGETAYTKGGYKTPMYCSDGSLVVTAQRVNETDFIGTTISSYFTMLFRYGVVEVRMDAPEAPAVTDYWINGVMFDDAYERWGEGVRRSVYTEIDVNENFGRVNNFAANVHRWWQEFDVNGKQTGHNHNSMDGIARYNGNSTNNKRFWYDSEKYGDDLEDDYHIYTVYWDDSRMRFCLDGKTFCDYDYNDNNSVSVHCLMNYLHIGAGMGSASYGETFDPEIHTDYHEKKIDYVRIYQTNSVNSQMVTAWPEKQSKGELKIFYPDHSYGNDY